MQNPDANATLRSGKNLAYLFSGQASQYIGMGQALYKNHDQFRKTLDLCSELAADHLNLSIVDLIYQESSDSSLLINTENAQPILFSLQMALAKMWESAGLTPHCVLGHSVGEFAAACVAGVFTLEDGMKIIIERARLMQSIEKKGGMLAITSGDETISNLIRSNEANVTLAAVNSSESVVVSGDLSALDDFKSMLAPLNIAHRSLNVSHAFHSPLMDPILDDFIKFADGFEFQEPKVLFVSSVTGKVIEPEKITSANYWGQQISSPVLFAKGVEELIDRNATVFLEIGPDETLVKLGENFSNRSDLIWLSSLQKQNTGSEPTFNTAVTLNKNHSSVSLPLSLFPDENDTDTNKDDLIINAPKAPINGISELEAAIVKCSGSSFNLTATSVLNDFGLDSLTLLKLRAFLIKKMGYNASSLSLKAMRHAPINDWFEPTIDTLQNEPVNNSKNLIQGFLIVPALAIFGELDIADAWMEGHSINLEQHCKNNNLDTERLLPLAEYLTWHGFLNNSAGSYSLTTTGRTLFPEWPSAMLYFSYYPLLTNLNLLLNKVKSYGHDSDVYRDMHFDSKASGLIGIRSNIFKQVSDFALNENLNGILDLGCGDGTFLSYMANEIETLKIVGLDQSEIALNLARDKFHTLGYSNRSSFIAADLMEPDSIKASPELAGIDMATIFFILHELAYGGTQIVVDFLNRFGDTFPDVKLAVTEQYRLSDVDMAPYLGLGYGEFLTLHDMSNQNLLFRKDWLDLFKQANMNVYNILEPQNDADMKPSWGTFIVGR